MNQTTWIWRLKTANNAMAGPGHSPPIPHPSPKQTPPKMSFQSIVLLLGSNSFSPKYGTFFTLIMYWKTIKFTATPHPSTNSSDGFQSLPIHKNWSMFRRRHIPATISPVAKIKPTKREIPFSRTIYVVVLSEKFRLWMNIPKTISSRPATRTMFAPMEWSYVVWGFSASSVKGPKVK